MNERDYPTPKLLIPVNTANSMENLVSVLVFCTAVAGAIGIPVSKFSGLGGTIFFFWYLGFFLISPLLSVAGACLAVTKGSIEPPNPGSGVYAAWLQLTLGAAVFWLGCAALQSFTGAVEFLDIMVTLAFCLFTAVPIFMALKGRQIPFLVTLLLLIGLVSWALSYAAGLESILITFVPHVPLHLLAVLILATWSNISKTQKKRRGEARLPD